MLWVCRPCSPSHRTLAHAPRGLLSPPFPRTVSSPPPAPPCPASALKAVAASLLGAKWIERHFTKDRTWKGTDHAASLEPAGLGKMCRDLVATYEALTYKATDVLDIEEEQRNKLKFRKQ